MSQAPTRSSVRIANRNSQRNNTIIGQNRDIPSGATPMNQNNTINSQSPASSVNRTVIEPTGIPPLMSIDLARNLGPHTTSSPESIGSYCTGD